MMRKLEKVHDDAIREFNRIQTALYHERMQCLEDRRFYSIAGSQWEGTIGEQFENRPKFEINKIHLSVIKIINEYRNNRITVNFISKDGTEDDTLADTCGGLFRADEQDSRAEEAYDNAFEEAVGGGFGAIRLVAEYEDDEDPENERQRIRIEPIYDADSSVFFDLNAKRQDKSDARCCFVLTSYTKEEYRRQFDDEAPSSVQKAIDKSQFDWYSPDHVYVAEYYEVEIGKKTLHVYKTLMNEEETYTEDELDEEYLRATGRQFVRKRTINSRQVHKYILCGNKVLEDCGIIAGKHIPIVPNYGKRWFVDSIERCMGHVRLSKDMQRIKNILMSKLAEISALSTTEKPIFNPEQIKGHEIMWSEDNIKNYPYLLINPLTDAAGNPQPSGPVSYVKPPVVPDALSNLMMLSDIDMKELLGNTAEPDKMLSHVSGKAHELLQKRIDSHAFIYMDNHAKAVRRVGEVWLSMARDVYIEEGRKMKTVDSTGAVSTVVLQTPAVTSDGPGYRNDLSKAAFDVTVDVGPSSASQREATVNTIMGMLAVTEDPQARSVLQALALYNMEGDGISQTRAYFRKQLVQMGVLQPTEEEAQAMAEQAQQPSPQDQAFLAMAAEANAKAQKTMAEIRKVLSDIELNAAKTAETYSEVDAKNYQIIKDMIEQEQREIEQRAAMIREAAMRQPQNPGLRLS